MNDRPLFCIFCGVEANPERRMSPSSEETALIDCPNCKERYHVRAHIFGEGPDHQTEEGGEEVSGS